MLAIDSSYPGEKNPNGSVPLAMPTRVRSPIDRVTAAPRASVTRCEVLRPPRRPSRCDPSWSPWPTSAGSSRHPRRSPAWRQYAVGDGPDAVMPSPASRLRPIWCPSASRTRASPASNRSPGSGPRCLPWSCTRSSGSSRVLSVGPESASALLVGSAVATLTRAHDLSPATAAAALALAVAVLALVGWLARLGFLADLLSKPVLIGYLAGVAVTMIVSQLPNITGITSDDSDTLQRALDVARGVGDVVLAPLLLGIAVVAALVLLQHVPRVPGPLLVVLGATVVTAVFDLEQHGVTTVGTVPSGLPALAFPSIPADAWPAVFVAATGVAIVAFSGNVLTGRAFARGTDDRIDADQELLSLAGANAAVGLAGGFPVSSSDSRTALAVAAGASSQLASLAAAASVAVVLVVAAPLLESFPLAALAGLVVYAAVKLIDLREIRRVLAFRRSEALLMTAAFVGVVAFDLLIGIGIAGRAQRRRPVPAGRPGSRRHPGLGTRPGRAPRHRRLPGREDHSGIGRLPLRRPPLLRQRRGLQGTRARRHHRRVDSRRVGRAQHGGERRDRPHRDRHARRAQGRTCLTRHRPRAGPREAGPRAVPRARRSPPADRRRPRVPDAADRARGLPLSAAPA